MEMKHRRRHYSLEMQSDGEQYMIKIEAPSAGDWYAIAFRSWTDPEEGKIKQQGRGKQFLISSSMNKKIGDKIKLYDKIIIGRCVFYFLMNVCGLYNSII